MTTVAPARPVLLGEWTPDQPEWHEARASRLGGSEIAAVLGLSPWQSKFSLWCAKTGAITDSLDAPELEWGRRLEPVLRERFEESRPGWLRLPTGTFVHPERTWQLANPDGLYAADPDRTVLWEGKTARSGDEWGEDGGSQIPVYYLAQVRWYLDVLGLREAWVSVLIAGSDYREYRVEQDDTDVELLRTAGAEFIASLTAGDRPDIDDHSATYRAVRLAHPDIDDLDVDIPAGLAADYERALLDVDTAEKTKSRLAALVLDAVGSGRRAVCDGRTIATRIPGRGSNPPFLRPAPRRGTKPTSVRGEAA